MSDLHKQKCNIVKKHVIKTTLNQKNKIFPKQGENATLNISGAKVIKPICSLTHLNLNILTHKFNPIKIWSIEFKMY